MIPVPEMVGIHSGVLVYAGHAFGQGASVDQVLAGTFFMDEDGQGFQPMDSASREAVEFLGLAFGRPPRVHLKIEREAADFERMVGAQFPSAGAVIAAGSEVVLQLTDFP